MREARTQVLVAGGGLGGVAAALAACARGVDVVLVEEQAWLGGQLTSQAVPPDEHPWIERFGCTARYRALRDGIRAAYRRDYPLTEAARARPALNPGASFVSAISHEPRVGLAVLEAMLAAPRSTGRLTVLTRHAPVRALADGDRVRAVTVRELSSGDERVVWADHVLDATETGDLLPLCGAEYVTGFEARSETGEPHAPATAQPLNMQAVTACFALDHLEGEDHTIERPPEYDDWLARCPPHFPEGPLSLVVPDPRTNAPVSAPSAQPAGDPRRSARTWPTPRSTATCGCSAGSRRAATSCPARTAATSRSPTGRSSTTRAARCSRCPATRRGAIAAPPGP